MLLIPKLQCRKLVHGVYIVDIVKQTRAYMFFPYHAFYFLSSCPFFCSVFFFRWLAMICHRLDRSGVARQIIVVHPYVKLAWFCVQHGWNTFWVYFEACFEILNPSPSSIVGNGETASLSRINATSGRNIISGSEHCTWFQLWISNFKKSTLTLLL